MTRNGLLNAKEAAKMIGISPATLYRLTKNNAFPHVRVSPGRIMFRRTEVAAWLEGQPLAQTEIAVDKTPKDLYVERLVPLLDYYTLIRLGHSAGGLVVGNRADLQRKLEAIWEGEAPCSD